MDSALPQVYAPRVGRILVEDKSAEVAASTLLMGLRQGDNQAIARAQGLFVDLATEQRSHEYAAVGWLAGWLAASPDERQALEQAGPDGRELIRWLGADQFTLLELYLQGRFGLDGVEGFEDGRFIVDLLSAGSPARADQERVDEVVEALELQPGQTVAEVGPKSALYTRRLAEAVGSGGQVLVFPSSSLVREYLGSVMDEYGLAQVRLGGLDLDGEIPPALGLPGGTVDRVFMSDFFAGFYLRSSREEVAQVLGQVGQALGPSGRLVIVSTDPVVEGRRPSGFAVSPDLAELLLSAHGFRLVSRQAWSKHRHLLQFEPEDGS
jgi:hypothetical protein